MKSFDAHVGIIFFHDEVLGCKIPEFSTASFAITVEILRHDHL
jgi:hypothetical protein